MFHKFVPFHSKSRRRRLLWYRDNRYFNFHTPRDPRARPLVDGESREPSESSSLVVSFPFSYWNRKATQRSGSAFGRKKEAANMGFRAPAEAEWSRLLLTLGSLSPKRERKNGGAKKTQMGFAHLTIPPSFASKCHLPTQGGFAWRRGWADEGIGPYKLLSGAARQLPQGSLWSALPIRSP